MTDSPTHRRLKLKVPAFSLRTLIQLAILGVLLMGGGSLLLPYFIKSNSAVHARPFGDPWFYFNKSQEVPMKIWRDQVALQNQLARNRNPRLVFIGDSLTERWKTDGLDVWREYYVDRNPLNLGIGGDKTEHVLWRLEEMPLEVLDPEVAVVLIGINNLIEKDGPKEVARGVMAVVNLVEARLPEARIVLLSLFPAGFHPRHPVREMVRKTNAAIARRLEGRNIVHLDIGEAFLEADGSIAQDIMPDELHLTEKGYRIWAEAMEPTLVRLLGQGSTPSAATRTEAPAGNEEERDARHAASE